MGIVTTSSETAFARSPETIYDFVTNPANWTKTYPGSAHITNLPAELIMTSYFGVRDGAIVSLAVINNQPSPY